MTATFTFSGASDDLVEYETPAGPEEIYSENWTGTLAAPDGSMAEVFVRYEQSGCWSVGVGPVDDDHPLSPGWAFQLDAQPGTPYSARLVVAAPDGTLLTGEGVDPVA